MDRDTLTDETIAAREANDHDRLNELAQAEKMNNLGDLEPQYAESDSSQESGGEGGLSGRARRAARMAQAGGNDALQDSLEAVAEAEDPAQELDDQETIVRATLGEDAAEALGALRDE